MSTQCGAGQPGAARRRGLALALLLAACAGAPHVTQAGAPGGRRGLLSSGGAAHELEEVHSDAVARSRLRSNLPARRRLINIQTANASYFHQPLVNCLNYTGVQTNTATSPACCTLSAQDCAARCDAEPTCVAFKYAWCVPRAPRCVRATRLAARRWQPCA
jgi:hypothetical protein